MTEDKDSKDKRKDLENLKKEYEILKAKYGLPEYSKLVEDFNSVERASDSETDYPIREIRRFVSDKILNFHRFIEALLNPMNVPMHIFSMIKTLGADEKKKLSEIYSEIAKIEISVMELDLEFSEKKEAEFIKNTFNIWQKIKKDFWQILEVVKKKWDSKEEEGKKGYFG